MFVFDFRPRRREARHRQRAPDADGAVPGDRVADLRAGPVRDGVLALLLVFFRASYLDFWGVVLCVAMMSISGLFYIIGGQWLVSKVWHLVPISGYGGGWMRALPGAAGGDRGDRRHRRQCAGIARSSSRRRARTTCARRGPGLSELQALFRHVLKNAMIPILTGVVVVIPSLFMGSLIYESFFGIPGWAATPSTRSTPQDFPVVRAMVFIGSLLYIVGLILTDLSYTLVDPRVRLE